MLVRVVLVLVLLGRSLVVLDHFVVGMLAILSLFGLFCVRVLLLLDGHLPVLVLGLRFLGLCRVLSSRSLLIPLLCLGSCLFLASLLVLVFLWCCFGRFLFVFSLFGLVVWLLQGCRDVRLYRKLFVPYCSPCFIVMVGGALLGLCAFSYASSKPWPSDPLESTHHFVVRG